MIFGTEIIQICTPAQINVQKQRRMYVINKIYPKIQKKNSQQKEMWKNEETSEHNIHIKVIEYRYSDPLIRRKVINRCGKITTKIGWRIRWMKSLIHWIVPE